MRVALIQMNTRDDKSAALADLERLLRQAVRESSPDLVVTPEYSTFIGGSRQQRLAASETYPGGEAYGRLSDLARDLEVGLHVGSMFERDGDRLHNTGVAFGRDGHEIGRYRKIHLFDVETPSGRVYRESEQITAGEDPIVYEFDGRTIGMSVCYDLRFAELYLRQAAMGAEVLTVPAAFTWETGQAHWQTLCRARAIETQCYVLAPAQIGRHPTPEGERPCNGESLVVDPWGKVVAMASDAVGWVVADLDFEYLAQVRSKIPVASHRRL